MDRRDSSPAFSPRHRARGSQTMRSRRSLVELLEPRALLSASPWEWTKVSPGPEAAPLRPDGSPARAAAVGTPGAALWKDGAGWQVSEDAFLTPAEEATCAMPPGDRAPLAATDRQFPALAEGSPLAAAPLGADYQDPSEYMLGDVWVTVVLLESDGSIDPQTENWSAARIAQVKTEIDEGLRWWEDTQAQRFPQAGDLLNFQVDYTFADQPVATGYEPIARSIGDQSRWMDSFLNQVGYNSSASVFTDLDMWNHDQRLARGADWAYTVFVVDSLNDTDGKFSDAYFAYAYLGGPFTVMTYDNNGWGISRMGQVLAHETGHIFYALDEYPSSNSYTATSGYYNTQNLNAADGNPAPATRVASIMAEASLQGTAYTNHTSSPTSLRMVGWQDSDGDGVFDVLDVPLSLSGQGNFDTSSMVYAFSGTSFVNTLDNLNPRSTTRHDITINTVDRLQYRLDGGAWIDGSSYGTYSANVAQAIDLSGLAAGGHAIEFRTIAAAGTVSNVVADQFRISASWTPPVAVDDLAETAEETPVTIDVLANDWDPSGGSLVVAAVTQGAHGSVSIRSDGSLAYRPAADYVGPDAFIYTARNEAGQTATASVTVAVRGVPDIRLSALLADRAEGDQGAAVFSFAVSLDQPAAEAISIGWAVRGSGITPADAADFGGILPAGTVTIPAGATQATIEVAAVGDTVYEADESFAVELVTSPPGTHVAVGAALAVIRNDDALQVFSYRDYARSETSKTATRSGTFAATTAADGVYETLTEKFTQKTRRARLEHSWTFQVTGGDVAVRFHVLGRVSSAAESFRLEYDAQDGLGYRSLVTLASTAASSLDATLPAGIAGTVVVRAIDTNTALQDASLDSLLIDELYFLSERTTAASPTGNVGDATEVVPKGKSKATSAAAEPAPTATGWTAADAGRHGDLLEVLAALVRRVPTRTQGQPGGVSAPLPLAGFWPSLVDEFFQGQP